MARPRLQLQPTIKKFLGNPGAWIDDAPCFIGADLSMRGLGLVRLPRDWMKYGTTSKEWFENVRACVISYPMPMAASENQRAHRLNVLVTHALLFIGPTYVEGTKVVLEMCAEQYAYSQGGQRTTGIPELGGALKCEMVRRGIRVEAVPASSARKLLLGKNPREDPKTHVAAALEKMGAEFYTDYDACDAFAVANWAAARVGASVTLTPPPVQTAIPGF